MDKDMTDYIANIIASALLAERNEEDDEILRAEHKKIVEKILD